MNYSYWKTRLLCLLAFLALFAIIVTIAKRDSDRQLEGYLGSATFNNAEFIPILDGPRIAIIYMENGKSYFSLDSPHLHELKKGELVHIYKEKLDSNPPLYRIIRDPLQKGEE